MSLRNGFRLLATRSLQAILRLRSESLVDALAPGPVLIVAPHPDDESLGCGRLIVNLCNRGIEVDLVWLTDGGASQSDFPGGPAALGATRRAEARAAGEILGLSPHRLHHLGAPDGLLPHLGVGRRCEVLAALTGLVETLRPSTVFVTSSLDDSTEHTAAHALVAEALRAAKHPAQLRTYLVWAFWKVRGLWTIVRHAPSIAFLPTTPTATATRHRALLAHRTQTTTQSPHDEPLLSRHFLACFPRTGEFFLSI
ncbi:MAG: PIG-L family deacetylase [Undibacterium sp.]|nr:PIG-L family deacetylase [Opitutaceae bacterium]